MDETTDIVERLRDTGVSTGWEAVIRDAHEAADTIATLRADLQKLRAELAEAERQIELMYEDLAGDSI